MTGATDPYAAIAQRAAEALGSLADGFRTLGAAASRAARATRADYVLAPSDHVEVLLDGEWTDLSDSISDVTVQPATPPRPNRAQRRHRAATPDRPAWQSPHGPARHH